MTVQYLRISGLVYDMYCASSREELIDHIRSKWGGSRDSIHILTESEVVEHSEEGSFENLQHDGGIPCAEKEDHKHYIYAIRRPEETADGGGLQELRDLGKTDKDLRALGFDV